MVSPTLRVPWHDLETTFRSIVQDGLSEWIASHEPHYGHNLQFALHRVEEGRQLVEFFLPKFRHRPVRVLDLGSGNGGIALALANHRDFAVTALDRIPNPHLRAIRNATGIPLHVLIGDARQIPAARGQFDVVLCLDMIEHVSHPREMGTEVMRVLAPGGVCMITTTPRIRYLFRPDPHFRITGLLLLPDGLQARVVRRVRQDLKEYDVEHTYWTVGGIGRCFPGRTMVQTLVNIPWPGIPRTPAQIAHYLFRRILWDRILIWR